MWCDLLVSENLKFINFVIAIICGEWRADLSNWENLLYSPVKIVLETINSTGKCLLRSMRKRAEKSFSHWLLFDQNSLSNNKGAPWWPLKRPSFIPFIVLDPLHLVDYVDLLFMILKRLNESIVFFCFTGCGNHITVSYWVFLNANTCFVWFPLISLHV